MLTKPSEIAELETAVASEFPVINSMFSTREFKESLYDLEVRTNLDLMMSRTAVSDPFAFRVILDERDDVEQIVAVFKEMRSRYKSDSVRLYKLGGDLWITNVDQPRAKEALLA